MWCFSTRLNQSRMKYLAAYALCALNGTPSKKDVEAVLKAGGVAVDGAKIDAVFAQFEGKNFADTVKTGKSKIGAAGPAAGAAPAKAAAAAPAAGKKEAAPAKKAESEDDGDMGGLFD